MAKIPINIDCVSKVIFRFGVVSNEFRPGVAIRIGYGRIHKQHRHPARLQSSRVAPIIAVIRIDPNRKTEVCEVRAIRCGKFGCLIPNLSVPLKNVDGPAICQRFVLSGVRQRERYLHQSPPRYRNSRHAFPQMRGVWLALPIQSPAV